MSFRRRGPCRTMAAMLSPSPTSFGNTGSLAGTRVKAVLFDYGLVLTGPAHPPAWEQMKSLLHAREETFHAAYWRYRQDYDSGALTGAAYWQHIAEDLDQEAPNATLQALMDADTVLWTQPNQPMINWAAGLQAAGIFTGILSNLGDAMEAGVRERCLWLHAFNHLTFSHRLRTTKPDPAIYAHAANGLGVRSGEILFIDDREDNVAGALDAGMQAIRYLDHESFLTTMRTAGLAYLLAPQEAAL